MKNKKIQQKKNRLAESIMVGNFILADRMNFSVKPLAWDIVNELESFLQYKNASWDV